MHIVVIDEFGNKLNVRVKKLDGNGGCHALKDTPHSAAGSSLFALQEVHIRAANFEFDVWRYGPPKAGDSGPKKKPTNGAGCTTDSNHYVTFMCVCIRAPTRHLCMSAFQALSLSLSLSHSLSLCLFLYNIYT